MLRASIARLKLRRPAARLHSPTCNETALAWLDRYYQERIRDALIAQRDEARLQVEVADAAYRGGRGSQADVFSARMVVAQLDDRIVQADRLVATAINRLARWVGDAANRPLGAAPNTDVFSVDWAKFEDHVSLHPQLELLLRQEQVAAPRSRARRRTSAPTGAQS